MAQTTVNSESNIHPFVISVPPPLYVTSILTFHMNILFRPMFLIERFFVTSVLNLKHHPLLCYTFAHPFVKRIPHEYNFLVNGLKWKLCSNLATDLNIMSWTLSRKSSYFDHFATLTSIFKNHLIKHFLTNINFTHESRVLWATFLIQNIRHVMSLPLIKLLITCLVIISQPMALFSITVYYKCKNYTIDYHYCITYNYSTYQTILYIR